MVTTKKCRAAVRPALAVASLVVWLVGCAPSGPEALLEGERQLKAGKPVDALKSFQSAIAVLDKHPQAWNHLGLAYHALGRRDDAVKSYRQALALDPNLAVVHFNLGCLWLEHNNPAAAVVELSSYTVYTNSPTGWLKRGIAEMRVRQFEAAERSLRYVTNVSPRSVEAINALGVLYLYQAHNRPREAWQTFSTALQVQPNYAPALLNLAVVTHQSFVHKPVDYRPSALQKYKEYLALQPRQANWEAVGHIVQQLEFDLAPKPLPVTVAVIAPPVIVPPVIAPPVTPPPTTNIVVVKPPPPVISNPPRVVTPPPVVPMVAVAPPVIVSPTPRVVPVITRPPAPPVILTVINPPVISIPPPPVTPPPTPSVEVKSTPPASLPEPVEVFNPPVATPRYFYRNPARPAPGNRVTAESAYANGQEAQERGRWKEAFNEYEKAVEADPSMFEAQHNLGLMAGKLNDTARSLQAYEVALALQPASLSGRFNFALALQRSGYHRDAANEFEKLLGDYPDEPRAHLALANIYAQHLYQTPQARQHYLKVLQLEPQHPEGTTIRYWLREHP